MLSLRRQPKLRLLFSVSKITGFYIPDGSEDRKKLRVPTAWEVTTICVTLAVFYLIMSVLISTSTSFKITENSQPVSIAMIYIMILTKSFNIMTKKKHLLNLLNRMDEIVRFQPFVKFQRPVVDLICLKIWKTMIILMSIAILSLSGLGFLFGSFTFLLKSKAIEHVNMTLTKEEEITNKLVRFGNWTAIHYIAFGLNGGLNIILPIKNIAMDSFLFLCHYFVVQQLNLLNKNFNKSRKQKLTTKKMCFIDYGNNDFENWIEMFNKIRK